MTHDELVALLNSKSDSDEIHALRAVVELHKPTKMGEKQYCECGVMSEELEEWVMSEYPCPTIQAIEKELV
jgi:hypothetical protein